MDLVSKPEFDVEVCLDFQCMYINAYSSMHWFAYLLNKWLVGLVYAPERQGSIQDAMATVYRPAGQWYVLSHALLTNLELDFMLEV